MRVSLLRREAVQFGKTSPTFLRNLLFLPSLEILVSNLPRLLGPYFIHVKGARFQQHSGKFYQTTHRYVREVRYIFYVRYIRSALDKCYPTVIVATSTQPLGLVVAYETCVVFGGEASWITATSKTDTDMGR
jgi:hypothetical protein